MEAAANESAQSGSGEARFLHASTLQFKVTPFRAERFALAYLEGVPKALDFGAKGYAFYRSDQDKDIFFHVSYWQDKKDFEQYWFSHEMQKIRLDVQGIFELHGYPGWHTVLEQHGIAD
jgi:quinol monooxygenase YgiN